MFSLLGVFTGQHHFKLHERKSDTTFEQSEDFSGLLAIVFYWVGSDMYRNAENGFKLINEALEERVEGISATSNVPGREWRHVQWRNDGWKTTMATGILQGV